MWSYILLFLMKFLSCKLTNLKGKALSYMEDNSTCKDSMRNQMTKEIKIVWIAMRFPQTDGKEHLTCVRRVPAGNHEFNMWSGCGEACTCIPYFLHLRRSSDFSKKKVRKFILHPTPHRLGSGGPRSHCPGVNQQPKHLRLTEHFPNVPRMRCVAFCSI